MWGTGIFVADDSVSYAVFLEAADDFLRKQMTSLTHDIIETENNYYD